MDEDAVLILDLDAGSDYGSSSNNNSGKVTPLSQCSPRRDIVDDIVLDLDNDTDTLPNLFSLPGIDDLAVAAAAAVAAAPAPVLGATPSSTLDVLLRSASISAEVGERYEVNNKLLINFSQGLANEYRVVEITDVAPRAHPASIDPAELVGHDGTKLKSLSATDTITGAIQRLSGMFFVLNRVDVQYGSSKASCMTCRTDTARGRLVVYLQHLCASERDQKVAIDVLPLCGPCAEKHIGMDTARAPAIRVVNASYAMSRMTWRLRQVMQSRTTVKRPSIESKLVLIARCNMCTQCGKDINKGGNMDYRMLVMRRGDTYEYGALVVCSAQCEKLFRTICSGTLKQLPESYKHTIRDGTVRFSSYYSRNWVLLTETQTASFALKHGSCLPRGAIIHRCLTPSCLYCTLVRAITESDEERTARLVRKRQQNTELDAKRKASLKLRPATTVTVSKEYEWLEYLATQFKMGNVYEDVLLSDNDALCCVCGEPTSTVCGSCGAVHVCPISTRLCSIQTIFTTGHKKSGCVSEAKTWSKFFWC